jgi:hypothetical protein
MSSLTCKLSRSANRDKVPYMPTVNRVSRLGVEGNNDFEYQTGRHVAAVLSQYSRCGEEPEKKFHLVST